MSSSMPAPKETQEPHALEVEALAICNAIRTSYGLSPIENFDGWDDEEGQRYWLTVAREARKIHKESK